MVVDPAEVHSSHATKFRIGGRSANSWVRADQPYCRSHGLGHRARCSRPVFFPPASSLPNLSGRSADEPRGEWASQPCCPSSRRNSSAGTTSPRSPSAIASRRAASSSGPRVNVSSFSGANTVTVEPSAKDSPGTSILPSTTFPVVTRTRGVYSSVSRSVQRTPRARRSRRQRARRRTWLELCGGASRPHQRLVMGLSRFSVCRPSYLVDSLSTVAQDSPSGNVGTSMSNLV